MAVYKAADMDLLEAGLTAIADALRARTGGTALLSFPDEFAGAVDTVFAAGRQAALDAFWDAYQQNGQRTDYARAFCSYWNDASFQPKYSIIIGPGETNGDYVFGYAEITDLEATLSNAGLVLDTSQCVRLLGTFHCIATAAIPAVDLANCKSTSLTFCGTTARRITVANVREDCTFDRTFDDNAQLTELNITGTFGNSVSFAGCPVLNQDSIRSILGALSDTASGMTVTLSQAAVNTAFETSEGAADGSASEDWLALAAAKANWTITLV